MVKRVIFNGVVAYDRHNARIFCINEPEKSVILFSPTNKCLALLIDTRPEVVSQNVFFEKVWEDEGTPITANTFYQHIAMLRKAFEEVGLSKKDIITIPRRGLILADSLGITFEDVEDSLPEDNSENTLPTVMATGRRNYDFLLRQLLIFLGMILVFCVIFFLSHQLLHKDEDNQSALDQYKFLGDINNCRVFVYSPLTTLAEVDKYLKRNRIYCKVNSHIYYASIPLLQRVSMIACSEEHDDTCRSYFSVKSR